MVEEREWSAFSNKQSGHAKGMKLVIIIITYMWAVHGLEWVCITEWVLSFNSTHEQIKN